MAAAVLRFKGVFPARLALDCSAATRAVADVLLFVCLPLFIYTELGEERLWVLGMVVAAPSAAHWLAAPFWGRLIDRTGRQRRSILQGLAAYGLLLGMLPALGNTVAILATLALAGLGAAALNPAALAWLTLGQGRHGLVRLARWHQWEAAGYFVGSSLMGWAVVTHPAALPWLFRVTAGLLGLCLLWVARTVDDRPLPASPPVPDRFGVRRRPARSRRQLETQPEPRTSRRALPRELPLFILTAFVLWEAVAAVFGLYFTQHLQASGLFYGATLGAATLIGLLAYGPLARRSDRQSPAGLFRWAARGYTGMYLLLVAPWPWLVGCGYLIPMAAVSRTAINAAVTRQVADQRRGQALGEVEAAAAAAAALGPLLGGILADNFGLPIVPWVALSGSLLLHLLVIPKD